MAGGVLFLIALVFLPDIAEASGFGEGLTKPLDETIAAYSLQAVYIAAIALGLLTFIAVILRNPGESARRVIFWSMTIIIALTTGVLIGMTIFLNQTSITKGPVHWHADFEIWACGEQQNLAEPQGLSNKIGTSVLHEHEDNRIHVEGVVVNHGDVYLGRFFQTIGGELTKRSLTIPTNAGQVSFVSGRECSGSNQTAQLQVFAYRADPENKTYHQEKLADPANYRLSESSAVPPGDCLIIEFDAPKERTDRLCQSYEVAKTTGDFLGEAIDEEGHGH